MPASSLVRLRLATAAPFVVTWLLALSAASASSQQPLETETARLPMQGTALIGTTYEFQTSPQGTEHALPFTFEYGITDRLALLIEPVLLTSIRPKSGRNATGLGDMEATVQYLVREETEGFPALALAGEIKVPTARDTLIGTRRTDFTPYLIASKRFGRFDTHANVGYSFVGKPLNIAVQNTLNLALAVEDSVTPRLVLMAEVLATTAAGSGGSENSTAPEIAGSEQVGMLGFRYAMRSRTWISLGVTYDNSRALLFRPGLTFETPF
jgi:hypothetical protein